MSNSPIVVTRKSLGWASLAAFGVCAACCALPLLAAAGIGGAALSAISGWIRPGADLVLAGVVGAGVLGFAAYRARAKGQVACVDACEVAGGCGCAAAASRAILSTPSPRSGEPIICTADLQDKPTVQAQLDGYRAAFVYLLRTESFPGGVRWVFADRPGLASELRNLAENEHLCCKFFKFDLQSTGETITWETRASDEARAVLEEFARLPERLSKCARGNESEPIKRAVGDAGLIFAADATSSK